MVEYNYTDTSLYYPDPYTLSKPTKKQIQYEVIKKKKRKQLLHTTMFTVSRGKRQRKSV